MDNEKLNETEETAENPEIKIDELGDGDLEDASGGSSNSGCNCNCGIE